MGTGDCNQSMSVPLYYFFFFTLSPASAGILLWGAVLQDKPAPLWVLSKGCSSSRAHTV